MSTITQVQCDIDKCLETAAFTNVETSVKSGQNLEIKKMDLCAKHKQELLNLTPLIIRATGTPEFTHTNATR